MGFCEKLRGGQFIADFLRDFEIQSRAQNLAYTPKFWENASYEALSIRKKSGPTWRPRGSAGLGLMLRNHSKFFLRGDNFWDFFRHPISDKILVFVFSDSVFLKKRAPDRRRGQLLYFDELGPTKYRILLSI